MSLKTDNHEHTHAHSHGSGKEIWLPILILFILFLISYCIDLFSSQWGFISYSIVTLIGLYPAFQKMRGYLKIRYIFSIELLLSLASLGAILIHAAAEAAAVVILFMIGEALEGYATSKAHQGIESLTALIPEEVNLVVEGGKTKRIRVSEITPESLLEIKPGDRFPVDGIIVTGSSYVDESLLTGESRPIYKNAGDHVVAGAICSDGVLIVKTNKVPSENTVTRLVKMVEKAQESKSHTMRTIEKFSKYYTPSVLALSIGIAFLPPLFHMGTFHEWIYKGLTILLIGCPCALIISTPSAIASGITAASRSGILIKNAQALELLGKIKSVAFDKTGTLTYGELAVSDVVSFSEFNEEDILKIAAAVEEKANHPLAKSIVKRAKEKNIEFETGIQAKTLPGKGASAVVKTRGLALVCSVAFAQEQNVLSDENLKTITSFQKLGKTTCVVCLENKVIGFIALADKLKEDAKTTLEKLHSMGIKTIILTGDSSLSANALAKDLSTQIQSELLPEHKWSYIKELSRKGKIAMVGDGINDAPALTAAHVGIAMGNGTDIAIDSAQIIITRNQVHSLVDAIQISQKTLNNMKQNIAISIGLKLFFFILTLSGDTTLWMAILADTGATVLVTLNAARLLGIRKIEV